MITRMKGPVIVMIVGFSAIILILIGLMIGWKWVAPATEEEPVLTTKVRVIERDLITAIESIPNLREWQLEYESWADRQYDMKIDLGGEVIYFYDRKFLSDFFEDLDKLEVFQK